VPAYETELQLGKQFGDNFQGGSDSVFGDDYRVNRDYYRVNKDCARIENQSSAGESVLSTISKSAATTFSVTIIESTGITESRGVITEAARTVRAYGTKH
jgi:hypothetical protein